SHPAGNRLNQGPSGFFTDGNFAGTGSSFEDRARLMSRSDVDRRPVIDGSPDLLDRGITHRDATLGPILVEAARISMTIPGRQAVYEDISAWIGMSLRCARPVLRTRIGNVQRKVIGRPSPSSVDAIEALEQAFTLENHNTIGLAERRLLCFGGSAASAHEVHATCQDQHPSHEAKWPRRGPDRLRELHEH